MLKQLVGILLVVFVAAHLLLYIFQRKLIYFPADSTPQLQDYHASDMELVTIRTKDGLDLRSWYKPAQPNQPTILYLHGNAGHIGDRMGLVRHFLNAGFGVLLLEYRGYGGNQGSPSEANFYEDARAGLQFLKQQPLESKRIVIYGESLGTGVTTKLAAENLVCAVVLQSPFTSLADLARYHYPWILVKPWDRYDSIARIKHIHAPLLFLHGTKDPVVPYSEGLALFNAANEPKTMLSFTNYEHNNLWNAPGFSEKIIDFVKNCQ